MSINLPSDSKNRLFSSAGSFEKFFPSLVGLLGGLGKFFHPVLLEYTLSQTIVIIIRNVFRKKACFDIHIYFVY